MDAKCEHIASGFGVEWVCWCVWFLRIISLYLLHIGSHIVGGKQIIENYFNAERYNGINSKVVLSNRGEQSVECRAVFDITWFQLDADWIYSKLFVKALIYWLKYTFSKLKISSTIYVKFVNYYCPENYKVRIVFRNVRDGTWLLGLNYWCGTILLGRCRACTAQYSPAIC